MVWETTKFKAYLSGRLFRVYCDNKLLKWLEFFNKPNSKLIGRKLKWEELNFSNEYKDGKVKSNADPFSHIEGHPKKN